jgi:uncharacterized protein YkwD
MLYKYLFILLSTLATAVATTPIQFQQAVALQNQYRALHSAKPLVWNATTAKLAQTWANQLAENNTFAHGMNIDSKGEWLGQNIASIFDSHNINIPYNNILSVELWYHEYKLYNYSNPGFSMDTGHFTQMVWKDTTSVGFGMAAKGSRTVIVTNYYPAGNYAGEYVKNVVPTKPNATVPLPIALPSWVH